MSTPTNQQKSYSATEISIYLLTILFAFKVIKTMKS